MKAKSQELVVIDVKIDTGFSGAYHRTTFEFDREEWDEMPEAERDELLEEMSTTFAWERISVSWKERDDSR